jgi:hypothetical protein
VAWLKGDFLRLPFEALMECYRDRSEVRSILCALYGKRSHNPVHECLVGALRDGRVQGIITTNYDLSLDDCVGDNEDISVIYDKVTCEKHYDRLATGFGSLPYVKLHGTALSGHEQELVCDLSSEGRLRGWKESLFHRLLKDRTLIVMGYSGRDFDICPELAWSTRQTRIVWLEYRADLLQPMAKNVLTARGGTLIEGDLLDFLSILLRQRPNVVTTRSSIRPELLFKSDLIPDWRVRLIDWLAAGELGLTCVDDLVGQPEEKSEMQAKMLGHAAKYRDAAAVLQRSATGARVTREARIRLLIGAAAAWFIYGGYLRSARLYCQARRLIWRELRRNKDLLTRLHEYEVMVYMRLAQIAEQSNTRWFVERCRKRARTRYFKTKDYLERCGAHGRLQALEHNAERLGIAKLEGLALPIDPGYRNLGLAAMHVIAQRDRLRATRDPWSTADVKLAVDCTRKADEYGWQHEAWKFSWLLFWHDNPPRRQKHWKRFCLHFKRTQCPAGAGTLLQLRRNAGQVDTSTGWKRLRLWLWIVRASSARL